MKQKLRSNLRELLKNKIKKIKIPKISLSLNLHSFLIVGLTLLLLIPFGIAFTSLLSRPVEAAWFDSGFSFRKKLPINNSSGSVQTDFQTQLTFDTASLITAGKMQSNCNDMRFTDVTGKLLSYWIEPNTCNTASTLVWVKINTIGTTGTDIYFYYGNPSAASQSQTMPTFIKDISQASAAWPLDDTTSTQSYSRVVNPGVATGRNIALNGTFSDSSSWTIGTGWTIAGGVASCDGTNGDNLRQTILVVGRAYTVTFSVTSYTSGAVQPRMGSGTFGTNRAAIGTYTETLIASGDSTFRLTSTNFIGSIDNVSVTELNIPASNSTPTQLLVDGDMEAQTTAAWTSGHSATLSKDINSPHSGTQSLKILNTGTGSPYAVQNNILVAGQVYRIYGYFRSDGSVTGFVADTNSAAVNVGTISTAWQPFDVTFVASNQHFRLGMSGGTTNQYVEFDDVVVSPDNYIRSDALIQDGGFETWTNSTTPTYWTPSLSGASTINQETNPANIHSGTSALRMDVDASNSVVYIIQPQVIIAGKTYKVSFWAKANLTAKSIGSDNGLVPVTTLTTSYAYYEFTNVATSSVNGFHIKRNTGTSTSFYFDDISVTEISPMSGVPTNGVLLAQPSNGHLTNAYTFDGSNDFVNIYSGSLNSAFNPSEGTVVAWAKVTNSGVWTDATRRYVAILKADANNFITIDKLTTSNTLEFRYQANGTNTSLTTTAAGGNTGWVQVVLTWSKTNNQAKAYINGAQTGSTLTGLDTWTGNLINSATVIGASDTSGTNPWSGLINDVRVYNYALSSDQIAAQYNASYDTQNYTTANFLGHELIRKFNTSVSAGSLATEEVGPASSLWWKFDEATGTLAKNNGTTANNGTLGGTTLPTWQTPDLCIDGGCLLFDGTSSKVTGSTAVNNIKTVAFWIKPSSNVSQGILNLDGGTHKVSTNSAGALSATGWTSPSYYINGFLTSSPVLTASQWQYVEITTGTAFNSTASFTLGTDGSTFTQGYIDEVKFFNYSRSLPQTQTDYNGYADSIGKFNQQLIHPNGLVAAWPLDDSVSTQSYSRVINPGVATGRNLITDPGFDDATKWTAGTGWTVSGGAAHGSAATGQLFASGFASTTLKRIYTVTFTISNYVSGSVNALLAGDVGPGTARSGNGTYSLTYTANNASGATGINVVSAFTGDIDNVSVNELNIPASDVAPNQLLNTDVWNNLGTGAWTASGATITAQTTTRHDGVSGTVLRVARINTGGTASQTGKMVIGTPYRFYGWVRSDGTGVPKVFMPGTGLFTGTTSTDWQPFDVVAIATSTEFDLGITNASGTPYAEFDVTVVALDTGIRQGNNPGSDLDMELTGTNVWGSFNASTLTKQGAAHSGAQAIRVFSGVNATSSATQANLVTGKTYYITGWYRGDGTGVPIFQSPAGINRSVGTAINTWQSFSVTFVATGTTIGLANSGLSHYSEYDDITITELDPMVGIPTNGVAFPTASNGHLTNAYSFDGTNDNVNIYSGSLNSSFNPNEGTVVAWAKVSNTGVWTDGAFREIVRLQVDANNFVILRKSTVTNTLEVYYGANGTQKTVNTTSLGGSTSWFQIVLSWSKSNDQVKMYLNGSQAGSTQTGLGTWTGNLASTFSEIGAQTSAGALSWSGLINDVQLYSRALTPAEIMAMYGTAPGPVGWWKMDEGTGTTTADSSTNGNTGTLTGGPTWASGKYGKAVNFDGTNDVITVPDSTSVNASTNSFTVAGWFNRNAFGNTDVLVNKRSSATGCGPSSTTPGYLVQIDSTNKLGFCVDDGTNIISTSTATTYSSSGWHQFEVVLDRSVNKTYTYIDGILQVTSSAQALTTLTNTQILTIGGKNSGGGNSVHGIMDDVKIYNYARSQSQILEDYGANDAPSNSGGRLPTPVAYYNLDESQGQTLNNSGSVGSSINGNRGNDSSVATDDPAWTTGSSGSCKVNGCLVFDGSNDSANLGTGSIANNINNAPGVTFSAWIYPRSYPTSGLRKRIINTNIIPGTTGIVLGLTNGSNLDIGARAKNTDTFQDLVVAAPSLNAWHHVVGVVDYANSKIYIYIDGTLRGTLNATFGATFYTLSSTQTDTLGSFAGGSDYYDGYIDEVKIYNVALSAAQVQEDYNGGLALSADVTGNQEASLLSDTAGNPPVAYWNFDEKTGTTANDKSGNGFSGALTSGPLWTTGKIGSAIAFNGSQYIDVADNNAWSANTTNALTVNSWFKVSNLTIREDIVAKGDTGQFEWDVRTETTGAITGNVYNAAGTAICTTTSATSAIAINTWYYESFVIDLTNSKCLLYLNGSLQQNSVLSGVYTNGTAHLEIASRGTNGLANPLTGSIDDVKIYNYARTQAQIEYDYNRGAPIGWWQFDECTGSTAFDNSGNSNNGTITIGGTGTQTTIGTCNTAGSAWGNGATGKFNSSLNFDGTDDLVNIYSAGLANAFNVNEGTVSVWAKVSGAGVWSDGATRYLVNIRADDSNRVILRKSTTNNTISAFYIAGGVTKVLSDTSLNATTNWFQVTITWSKSGDQAKLYINGMRVGSILTGLGTWSGSLTSSTVDIASFDNVGTTSWSGQIDDTRVYNYALSQSQVQQIYNGGFGTFFGPATGSP